MTVPQSTERSGLVPGTHKTALKLGLAGALGPIGGFTSNIIYARTIGPSGRGDLAAVLAAVAVSEVVLAFGLPDVLTRHVTRGSLPRGSGQGFLLGLVVLSLLPAGLAGTLARARGFSLALALLVALMIPTVLTAALAKGILLGQQAYRRLGMSALLGGIVRVGAPFVLLLVGTPRIDLALLLALCSTVVATVPIFIPWPFKADGGSFHWSSAIATEALKLWPASLAWSLNSRLDQLLLAGLVPAAMLGRYAVCVAIAEVPLVVASGLRQVVLVRVSSTHDPAAVLPAVRAVLAVGLGLSVVALPLSDAVLKFLFGEQFGGTGLVLVILLAATSFAVAASLENSCLIAIGAGGWRTVSQMVGVGVTLVGLPLVVNIVGSGLVGIALVSLAAYCSVFVASYIALKRLVRFATRTDNQAVVI